jgi:ribose 5-phosphate isomerase B
MKIAIASDVSGFNLKEQVRVYLTQNGFDVSDVGQTDAGAPMMYYDIAARLAKAVQRGEFQKGVVICGTGAGVSMIANRFKGVYCVPCESVYTAEKISLINNANVLAMGEKIVSFAMGCEMALAFLRSNWCEGFEEQRRLNNERGYAMLAAIERGEQG